MSGSNDERWHVHESKQGGLAYITTSPDLGKGVVMCAHLTHETADHIVTLHNKYLHDRALTPTTVLLVPERADHEPEYPPLTCPGCRNAEPYTITVARDTKGTRRCQVCYHVWLPADDIGPSVYNPNWDAVHDAKPTEAGQDWRDAPGNPGAMQQEIDDLAPASEWEVFTAADGERAIRRKGHDGLLDPVPGADESDNPMVRQPAQSGSTPDPSPLGPRCTCLVTPLSPCPAHVGDNEATRLARAQEHAMKNG